MPSQEEYLDQLLKGITDDPAVNETVAEETTEEEAVAEELVVQEPVFEMPELEELEVEFADIEPADIGPIGADLIDLESDEDILRKMVLENATIEDVLSDAAEEDTAEFMSVDEIEQILAANNSEEVIETAVDLDADEDLMSLLGESSNDELQDIYDMLHKSDNNEAIDDEIYALLQGDSGVDEAARLQAELDGTGDSAEAETPALSAREQKALEKKRLKEEKAAAKRAAKEAKKAKKEAQRAAKKAAKETAKENAESAATSNEAAGADVFEGIDELSTADMLDLQELLSVGDMQSPSDDTITQLQQEVKPQSRPVIVDVPEDAEAPAVADVDENMAADMLEIDELLSLAGISSISEADITDTAEIEAVDASMDVLVVDEDEIRDLIPEKAKKSLFARILDFLTETDEDEEEKGTEDIPLSDENKNILEEMDKEAKSGKKKGKKAKKGKKDKNDLAELETLGDDEEVPPKDKKGKKAKKPKKEKEKHVKVMPLEDPKSKIPLKAKISVVAVCASVLAVVLILVNLGGDFALKREAKKAYYAEDYETCYQTLYGKELNESEQVMFAKSESILRINLRVREYEMFVEEQSEVEALDVLIQTVYDYAELYEYASKWNAGEEVSAIYAEILGVLQEKYDLTESDALAIAAEPDDVEYTKIVTAVAEGTQYSSINNDAVVPENLPDMLPEELQFPENNGGQ